MRLFLAATTFVAFVALFSQPSRATQYLISYNGVLTSGLDTTGMFYAPNTDLVGKSIQMDFVLTLPTPGAISATNGISNRLYGGASYGAPSPLAASVTINGVTQYNDGLYVGDTSRSITPGAHNVYAAAYQQRFVDGIFSSRQFVGSAYGPGFNLSSLSLGSFVDANVGGVGSFFFNDRFFPSYDAINVAGGEFTVTAVKVSEYTAPDPSGAAVPEPQTWALMIAGFGLVGRRLRYRRQGAVFAA